ncbi:MAG: class I SAM-dependent methyltransferase [Verrucomicrobiales bacterium]|nr:class I SAM-dependent methyltransferase [Verrucomicrobiales bacterium]
MSFDRLARHYRWMEFVLAGGLLQRARTVWLPEVPTTRRALLLGEGNGRFLGPALAALPDATFHCVDASGGMLEQASRAVSDENRNRVTFEVASLPDWRPTSGSFDLVVTNFFLDCFPSTELPRVMAVIADAISTKAAWLLTDFAIPTGRWRKVRAQLIHQAMYTFFRWSTKIRARRLIAPEPLLSDLGFERQAVREFEWGLVRSSLWRRIDRA